MSTPCRWEDEDTGICVNAACPMCCDFCPIPDNIPDVCKWEDRTEGERDADDER